MVLETDRLVLRPWKESDAESLYEYAKNPEVGPSAGWPAHKSVEESLEVIRYVFNGPECYAICEKGSDKAIGAVELKLNGRTESADECELGYWIGKPFWGRGYVPEAAKKLLERGFETLGMRIIWCCYYDENVKSKRVAEKLGFVHHSTRENEPVPLLGVERVLQVSRLTEEMWGEINFNETLEKYISNLDELKEWIESETALLKAVFFREYKYYSMYDEYKNRIPCNDSGFDTLLEDAFEYIVKQRIFINKILELDIFAENKFNKHIKKLLSECLALMKNELPISCYDNVLYDLKNRCDFSKEYDAILLLAKFSHIEKNIVLIGGNGSGKSSLANALKGNETENICVIPAQKSLYFTMNDMSMLSTRAEDLVKLLLENNISKSKTVDDYDYFEFQKNQFTKLIVAMKEQYTEYLIECDEKGTVAQSENTIFGQLIELFKIIFPEIKLSFKSEAREYLNCIKNGKEYHINSLSEGEKAVIYYAVSVLMAKEDSFIVVDEPETYLNPSLTNMLWDQLIKIRRDCQFIFITHSVDFVLGRDDSQIAWIKNFQYPNEWEFEFIKDEFALPKTLMTEILGSKKPVLFCEGDDKSSLDYAIYRALFGNEYTVLPVGGHMEVIKNCEVIQKSPWMNIDTMGIIDGDCHSREKIESLKEKNIKVLPFNEIEMFLISDEILNHIMKKIYPMDYLERITAFKKEFYKTMEKNKEKIALNNVMLNVNEFIATEKIQKVNSVSAIEDNLKKISKYNVQEAYDKKVAQIISALKEERYEELLLICNLKKEITAGVGNRLLDSNYDVKVKQQIQVDEELKTKLIEKYFS